MIIRHAEKPANEVKAQGVTAEGKASEGPLTVRGWQRAGALAHLLAPSTGQFAFPLLEKPSVIYASSPSGGSKRPLETIRPLAQKIGLDPVQTFTNGEEADLVAAVRKERGVVLICWQHERIVGIATRLTESGPPLPIPDSWPEDRFDMIWIFAASGGAVTHWEFAQVPQLLLAGDEPKPIESSASAR